MLALEVVKSSDRMRAIDVAKKSTTGADMTLSGVTYGNFKRANWMILSSSAKNLSVTAGFASGLKEGMCLSVASLMRSLTESIIA